MSWWRDTRNDLRECWNNMRELKMAWLILMPSLMVGIVIFISVHDSSVATLAKKRLEDQYTVEPKLSTIPITDGRVLECYNFPMHTWDGHILTCIACQEQSADFARHELRVVQCK